MMIAALLVYALIIGVGTLVILTLGSLPGRIARARHHPQSEMVAAAGWIGLLTGVIWILALIWSFYRRPETNSTCIDAKQPLPDSGKLAYESEHKGEQS